MKLAILGGLEDLIALAGILNSDSCRDLNLLVSGKLEGWAKALFPSAGSVTGFHPAVLTAKRPEALLNRELERAKDSVAPLILDARKLRPGVDLLSGWAAILNEKGVGASTSSAGFAWLRGESRSRTVFLLKSHVRTVQALSEESAGEIESAIRQLGLELQVLPDLSSLGSEDPARLTKLAKEIASAKAVISVDPAAVQLAALLGTPALGIPGPVPESRFKSPLSDANFVDPIRACTGCPSTSRCVATQLSTCLARPEPKTLSRTVAEFLAHGSEAVWQPAFVSAPLALAPARAAQQKIDRVVFRIVDQIRGRGIVPLLNSPFHRLLKKIHTKVFGQKRKPEFAKMARADIRIFSPFFPFPAHEGAFQVIYEQAQGLCDLGFEVELVVWKSGPGEIEHKTEREYPGLFDGRIRLRCLAYDQERESRVIRIARVVASLASPRSSPEEFFYPRAMIKSVQEAFRDEDEALNIYHYSFAYGWLSGMGRRRPPGKTVVVFHNLESDLFMERAKEAICARSPGAPVHLLNAAKLRAHESAISNLIDEAWFVSSVDHDEYKRKRPGAPSRFVPPVFSPAIWSARSAGLRKATVTKTILGFVGALDFIPNQQSAAWVIDRLAPELSKRGFAGEVWIVGKECPAELVQRASAHPFVKVLGFVADLDEYWSKLSYSLIPHVSGSGVRVKLLESLASGVPVLANAAAVERIDPSLRKNPYLHVSEDPGEWADRVMRGAPMSDRERFAGSEQNLPSELRATEVYRFLREHRLPVRL